MSTIQQRQKFSLALALVAALGVSIAAQPLALGQTAPTDAEMEQAKSAFGEGRELYDGGDKRGAVAKFKQAYRLSRNAVLLYNIGFIYDELGDTTIAVHYYEKFLRDAPEGDATKANRRLAKQRIKKMTAVVEEPAPKASNKKAAKPAAPSVEKFMHVTVDEAPPEMPLDVAARIPEGKDWSLTLFFRKAGQTDFKPVKMEKRYSEYVARIPAGAMQGTSMQYYIEVRDGNGKVIDKAGKASSPNVVFLDRGAKPQYYADMGEARIPDYARSNSDLGVSGPNDSSGWSGWDYARWGTTGAAAALLVSSGVLYMSSKNYSSTQEDEARVSAMPDGGACPANLPPPCQVFGNYNRDLEEKGRNLQRWGNISLGVGLTSAGVAGYLWYREIKENKKARRSRGSRTAKIYGAPMVTDEYVGGAAVFSF